MEKIIISCLESRVETDRSMYARFLLGPFKDDNAITIATALRRSLLSKVKSIAITAIHIQGVTHEFSTIYGVRESVLDLALNFQQVVLRTKNKNGRNGNTVLRKTGSQSSAKRSFALQDQILFGEEHLNKLESETVQIGYLQMQGPAVVYANDLKLPAGVECVDPSQYIATLSTEGLLVVKFLIGKKKASINTNNGISMGNKMNADIAAIKQNFVPAVLDTNTKFVRTDSLHKQDFDGYAKAKLLHVSAQRDGTGKESKIINKVQKSSASQESIPLQEQNSFIGRNENMTPALSQLNNQTNSQYKPPFNPFKSFDSTTCLRNTIFLDPIFDSVIQANYIIEKDDLFDQARERILLEFWTNGSVHPRQALHKASLSLISTFSIFRKVFHLDSL